MARTSPKPSRECKCFRYLSFKLTVTEYPNDFEGLWRYTDVPDPLALSSAMVAPGAGHPTSWISYYHLAGDIEWTLRFDDRIGCGDPLTEYDKMEESTYSETIVNYGGKPATGGAPSPLTPLFPPTGGWWIWLPPGEEPPTQEDFICNYDEMLQKFSGRIVQITNTPGTPPDPPSDISASMLPVFIPTGVLVTSPFACPTRNHKEIKFIGIDLWLCSDCKRKGRTTPPFAPADVDPPSDPLGLSGPFPSASGTVDGDCKNPLAQTFCAFEGWWSPLTGKKFNPLDAGNVPDCVAFVMQDGNRPQPFNDVHQNNFNVSFELVDQIVDKIRGHVKKCPNILPLNYEKYGEVYAFGTQCEDLNKWCKIVSDGHPDSTPYERYRALPRRPH